ncbi:MAG: Fe-S oxidoreductase [Canibacter sp.]
MQLGTRWNTGQTPPGQVPAALRDAIRAHESDHPEASAWTLTWLEGKPRLQLIDEAILTVDARGEAVWEQSVENDDEDDDWLL